MVGDAPVKAVSSRGLTRRLYVINVFYDNRQTPQDRMPKTSLDFLFSLITYAKENNYG